MFRLESKQLRRTPATLISRCRIECTYFDERGGTPAAPLLVHSSCSHSMNLVCRWYGQFVNLTLVKTRRKLPLMCPTNRIWTTPETKAGLVHSAWCPPLFAQPHCPSPLSKNRVPEDKDARDALLKNFKHTSKKENPLYSTTNNDIGIKRPTGATFTFERRARQQGFRCVAARYCQACRQGVSDVFYPALVGGPGTVGKYWHIR